MADSFRPPERIGFVGLGNMGAPMARRLAAAGFRLAVADANHEAVTRFADQTACERPADLESLGAGCRAVITMLPNGRVVRTVLMQDHGVVAGLKPGSFVIDMSSSAPTGTLRLAQELERKDIALLDAPVSGGVKKAVDGTLAIMTGGEAGAVERCRPVLEAMGKVFTTGGPGSGHAMKALNNYLSAASLSATAEAVIAGAAFGLDPKLMIDVLNASTGRSATTEFKYPTYVLPRTFDSGFALGLMAKDLRLALELAQATGAPSVLLEEVARLWADAEQKLGFRADHTEIVRYLESRAGAKPAQS
jgi:3-hydroxyisobutyrate dehydrogenase